MGLLAVNGPETTLTPGSSNIEAITFDPDTDTLTVEFRDGSSYDYLNVPVQVYRAFQRAGSAGEFFYRQIRNRYAFDGPN